MSASRIPVVATLAPVVRLFAAERRALMMAGVLLAAATVVAGMLLLGLSGWFITATALAGASVATALAFDVFAPSAGIRFFALARTAARYGERLVTHDATLKILAALRERLFRGWAGPEAARALLMRPARLLFRLTADIDALDSLYLRLLVPAGAALAAAAVAGVAFGAMNVGLGLAVAAFLALAGFGLPLAAAWRSGAWARRRARIPPWSRGRAPRPALSVVPAIRAPLPPRPPRTACACPTDRTAARRKPTPRAMPRRPPDTRWPMRRRG